MNRTSIDPWLSAAADKGVTVNWIPVDSETLTLDLSGLDRFLEATRSIARTPALQAGGSA